MKRIIVNLGVALCALLIGLSINNACASKIDDTKSNDEGSVLNNNVYFTQSGDLLFGPDGKVANKVKNVAYSWEEGNLISDLMNLPLHDYTYDEEGHLLVESININKSNVKISRNHSYEGLKETISISYWENYGEGTSSVNYTVVIEYLPIEQRK